MNKFIVLLLSLVLIFVISCGHTNRNSCNSNCKFQKAQKLVKDTNNEAQQIAKEMEILSRNIKALIYDIETKYHEDKRKNKRKNK